MNNPRDSQDTPRVAAMVLTWEDTEMTARCVESLYANTYRPLDIVVTDNGSNPPCAPALKERFPDIETVQLDRNYGFTGGCNRGIERAIELGAKYVFLLNNDTIIHPEAIRELVHAMEARPDVAMASAVLLFPGEEKRIQFIEGHIERDRARHVHPHENEILGPQHRKVYEIDYAPSCAALYRAEALKQVGLYDESLFTNWEDYDLCLRLLDAGWKLISVGAAEVVHAHGQTTGKISPFITYFYTRNRLICLFRYGRLGGIAKFLPRLLRQYYGQINHYGWTNWPCHYAFARGVFDFAVGIRGQGGAPKSRKDRK